MFKTIACAMDCSPSTLNALTVAKKLAQENDGKLVIIHVQEIAGRAGILVDSNDAALAELHRTAQQLQDAGIDAAVLWSTATAGGTARMIVQLAEDAGADLIVVGNRGDGPLTKLMLGSVASRVLQTARCPVLMVPARQQAERSTVTPDIPPGLVRSQA